MILIIINIRNPHLVVTVKGKNEENLVIVLKFFEIGTIYICELNKKVVYYKGEHSFLVVLERIEQTEIKDYKPCQIGLHYLQTGRVNL